MKEKKSGILFFLFPCDFPKLIPILPHYHHMSLFFPCSFSSFTCSLSQLSTFNKMLSEDFLPLCPIPFHRIFTCTLLPSSFSSSSGQLQTEFKSLNYTPEELSPLPSSHSYHCCTLFALFFLTLFLLCMLPLCTSMYFPLFCFEFCFSWPRCMIILSSSH